MNREQRCLAAIQQMEDELDKIVSDGSEMQLGAIVNDYLIVTQLFKQRLEAHLYEKEIAS